MATKEITIRLELSDDARVLVGATDIISNWLGFMTNRAHLVLTAEELPEFIQDARLLLDCVQVLKARNQLFESVKEEDGQV